MAQSGKRKTTMAKLTRERRLLERRIDKQAKKEARKRSSADHSGQAGDDAAGTLDQAPGSTDEQGAPESVDVATGSQA